MNHLWPPLLLITLVIVLLWLVHMIRKLAVLFTELWQAGDEDD